MQKIDAYFEWAKHKYTQVDHASNIGRAHAYSIIRNNICEFSFLMVMFHPTTTSKQAIRPFTIGRKNFNFMEIDHGAKTSAMIYSIIETAKANELNTYQYLELLLTELPKHSEDKNLSFLDDLLP